MRIVITGSAGFLGRILVNQILQKWDTAHLTLVDRERSDGLDSSRVTQITGTLPHVDLGEVLSSADVIFHLASLPGGASERDYEASRAVNLEASLQLLEKLASRTRPARFVYASSVAVFGEPLPPRIDDATLTLPTMTYGTHKLMVETALANLTRRGRIGGIALRLCGLLARPAGGSAGLRSAFMSELFHACSSRRALAIPTQPNATVWVMSATCAAENLIHAAGLSHPHALTLPAIRVTMEDLVAAVVGATGCDPGSISYEPDDELERQFGRLPELTTEAANALGFRHDGGLDALVSRALRDAGYSGGV